MERSLLVVAVVVGVVGWLAALLMTLRSGNKLPAICRVFSYPAIAFPGLVLVANLVRMLALSSGEGPGAGEFAGRDERVPA